MPRFSAISGDTTIILFMALLEEALSVARYLGVESTLQGDFYLKEELKQVGEEMVCI